MLDGNFRNGVDRLVRPVGRLLVRLGVSANFLTCIGLGMSVAACLLIGSSQLQLGLIFLILTAVPDLLDGAVAVAAGTSSKRGAFFDSTADRVTDGLLLCGVAWHLADTKGGTIMLLPMAVLATASLISYERAKAELLGYEAKGGLFAWFGFHGRSKTRRREVREWRSGSARAGSRTRLTSMASALSVTFKPR